MNLSPTEQERLTIFTAAELARRYRREGIRLSAPEATALIADEVITAARKDLDHPALVALGTGLLSHEDVEDGVPELIPYVSVEVMMAEGTKLVTIHQPIQPNADPAVRRPGEVLPAAGAVTLNRDRPRVELSVTNTGDRTIQVRSHTHFFEVNRALDFDREQAYGMRLDVPSGTGVRFEPGVARTVTLVPFGGLRSIRGGGGLTTGRLDDVETRFSAMRAAQAGGYRGARASRDRG